MAHTFKKYERLCNYHTIKTLFSQNKYIKIYPLRLLYLPLPDCSQTQVLVSVSKRYFKRAVERNRIKRLLREAYRLQKETLPSQPLALALLYQSKQKTDYHKIYNTLSIIIKELNQNIKKQENERDIQLLGGTVTQ